MEKQSIANAKLQKNPELPRKSPTISLLIPSILTFPENG